MWRKRYETEIKRARERVGAVPSRSLQTTCARIEYAVSGSGQPVLMSHGVMGGHAEGLGMVTTYYGNALAIAPSRFGYFGSELPDNATPALQADVYAELLDALMVERCVVIGFSAGGPSTIEFALRHPQRVELLVLASSALPRESIPWLVRTVGPTLMTAGLRSDWPFWLFKTLMPGTFRRLLGVPKTYALTKEVAQSLREVAESLFPIRPRRKGAVFDAFTGNPLVNNCPLERISVPTLIIHAADDALAPYQTACDAAARMPSERFVTIDAGGHEFLGHEAVVRDAVRDSLQEIRQPQRAGI